MVRHMGEASVITETITPYTVKPGRFPPFTTQNARMFALKSAEARRAKREAQAAIQPANGQQAQAKPNLNPSFISTRARKLEKLIDGILTQLATTDDAKEQQAKAMALDRLFGAYAYMTGLERPGVSRGSKRRSSQPPLAGSNSPEDV